MRIHGSITALSWIPSEAITGLAKLPFGMGLSNYDPPPPETIGRHGEHLEALRDGERFRFANHLRAWIDVADDASVTGAGYDGGGLISHTRLNLGKGINVPAVALDDQQSEPVIEGDRVRFTQTAGGRTGVPAPRHVSKPPFVQYHMPIAWSTLNLTIATDGRVEGSLTGASPFPRHWIYDNDGNLIAKSGLIDFSTWYRSAFGKDTPWGELDSPALVTAVESALERELSSLLMAGSRKPQIHKLHEGDTLVRQGEVDQRIFVLLDGVIGVEVDGHELCELGPGAVLGERSIVENSTRTATLRAVTRCKVAAADASDVDREALVRLAAGHRREENA